MGTNEGENERYDMPVNGDIRKVVLRLAAPTVISVMVSSIYNTAGASFVSQLDTDTPGAVGVIFSITTIIQASSPTIGVNTGNHMACCLGVGRTKEGEVAMSVAFFTGIILGTCLGFVRLLHIDQIVVLLGVTETIKPYTVEYAHYIFIAAPFMMCSFIMNNLLRLQGLTAFAMISITMGGILNTVLDPLFIFDLDLGTPGTAIATGLSQFISFCILLAQYSRRKGCIPIRLRNLRSSPSLCEKTIYGGIPSLTRQGMASIATIILNATAHPFGDAAIATMATVNRLIYFIDSTIIGFGQDFRPVCAFSYGAKKYVRARQAYIPCVKFTTCILIVIYAGVFLISGHVISLFREDDPAVIAIGTLTLRLQLITMWFNGFLTMSNMVSQSIGYGFRVTLLSTSRQRLFLIPILLLATHFLGFLGIQTAQPTAGVYILVLTTSIIRETSQSLPQESQEVRDIQGLQDVRS